jgi:hypothetical protein
MRISFIEIINGVSYATVSDIHGFERTYVYRPALVSALCSVDTFAELDTALGI